jgi:lipoate-protein ligase A
MFCIINNSKDIYFNLALEEYLLRSCTEDFFMVWQSDMALVAGKHQNILAEMNHTFIRQNRIQVARRITGGGTVFHGPGNLNFTFIQNGTPGKLVNFWYFVTPIIQFLKTYNLSAEIGLRNELLLRGKKISGNAEHVFKNRVLHHGTLLYNANLDWLNQSIEIVSGRYFDKAVQSFRSEVCNISEFLETKIPIDEFASDLTHFLTDRFAGSDGYKLTEDELKKVNILKEDKYSRPEWIYGYSPPFEIRSSFTLHGALISIYIKVNNGKITDILFSGGRESNQLNLLSKKLQGIYFSYDTFHCSLMNENVDEALIKSLMESIF